MFCYTLLQNVLRQTDLALHESLTFAGHQSLNFRKVLNGQSQDVQRFDFQLMGDSVLSALPKLGDNVKMPDHMHPSKAPQKASSGSPRSENAGPRKNNPLSVEDKRQPVSLIDRKTKNSDRSSPKGSAALSSDGGEQRQISQQTKASKKSSPLPERKFKLLADKFPPVKLPILKTMSYEVAAAADKSSSSSSGKHYCSMSRLSAIPSTDNISTFSAPVSLAPSVSLTESMDKEQNACATKAGTSSPLEQCFKFDSNEMLTRSVPSSSTNLLGASLAPWDGSQSNEARLGLGSTTALSGSFDDLTSPKKWSRTMSLSAPVKRKSAYKSPAVISGVDTGEMSAQTKHRSRSGSLSVFGSRKQGTDNNNRRQSTGTALQAENNDVVANVKRRRKFSFSRKVISKKSPQSSPKTVTPPSKGSGPPKESVHGEESTLARETVRSKDGVSPKKTVRTTETKDGVLPKKTAPPKESVHPKEGVRPKDSVRKTSSGSSIKTTHSVSATAVVGGRINQYFWQKRLFRTKQSNSDCGI